MKIAHSVGNLMILEMSESERQAVAQSFFLEGRAAEKRRQDAIAVEKYSLAIRHWEDYMEAWIRKGDIFLRRKRYDLAESCFRGAIQIDPQNFVLHSCLADALEGSGQLDAAVKERTTVIDLRQGYGGPHVLLAQTYEKLENWELAIQQLQVALRCPDADKKDVRETIYARIKHLEGQRFAVIYGGASLIVNPKKRILLGQE